MSIESYNQCYVSNGLSLREICNTPTVYRRGYDDGTMASLYTFVRTLFRVFHSIDGSIDLLEIGYEWNKGNYDPELKIQRVLETVCREIKDDDVKAFKKGEAVPDYTLPEGESCYIPVNLRCNDYMDVLRLAEMTISTAKEVINAAKN